LITDKGSKGRKEYSKYVILNTGVVYICNRHSWLDINFGYVLHTVCI